MLETKRNDSDYWQKLMVDIDGLQNLLSCGKATCRKIADEAGAAVRFGRRKLYSVQKIKAYLEKLAG